MPNLSSPRSTRLAALACIAGLGVAGACSRPTPQAEPAAGTPMAIAAPADRTWTATAEVLAGRHLPVGTMDRAAGLIVVNAVRINPASAVAELASTAHPWADCGSIEHEYYQPNTASYTAHVLSDGAASTVAIAVTYSAANAGSPPRPCTSKGVLEAELGKEIKEHAERRSP